MKLQNPIIAANWKMHKHSSEVKLFFDALVPAIKNLAVKGHSIDLWVAPSFPYISLAANEAQGSGVKVGAQNICYEEKGALTGEVSASQVVDAGASFAIIGHSERRKLFFETGSDIQKKVKLALKAGLIPLLCVGETLEERKTNHIRQVIERQIREALEDIQDFTGVIAYEPVWAIGTGQSATAPMIEEAHAICREIVQSITRNGKLIPILYGGSVNTGNVFSMKTIKGVDGLLIGGASLEAKSFIAIIEGYLK